MEKAEILLIDLGRCLFRIYFIILMLLGDRQRELDEWRTSIHQYEKNKRSKKPFGKDFKVSKSLITEAQMKKKDQTFHPVLQTYASDTDHIKAYQKQTMKRERALMKHLNQVSKYDRNYDIVNLHGEGKQEKQKHPTVQAPIRNLYNPISNKALPQYYFKGRQVVLPLSHEFKSLDPRKRDFNIISGEYHKDNDTKVYTEMLKEKNVAEQRLEKSHIYDPVFGRYYNSNLEQDYEESLAKSELLHGSNFQSRFPPTYKSREPLILDSTKPLPEAVKKLDKKREEAKRRFKMKYVIEDDYAKRNVEDDEKKESVMRNRIKNSQKLEKKAREFDIINLKRFNGERGEQSTWDKLLNSNNGPSIKSTGFR